MRITSAKKAYITILNKFLKVTMGKNIRDENRFGKNNIKKRWAELKKCRTL